MDNKPSLSQYFGDTDPPPTTQFFDEIGTASSDMTQSIYLGDGENKETTTASVFPQKMSVSFGQQQTVSDLTFSNVLPTVSSGVITASDLPDPSTFFDNIGPEPPMGVKNVTQSGDVLSTAMEGLTVKPTEQQVDKEADRRRDAWIPNEEAQKSLIKAQSSPKGSFFPDREVLTMPGLMLEEELTDSLQDAASRLLGVSAWGDRSAPRAERAPRDEAGLLGLLRAGRLRAALNVTGALIDAAAQGLGRVNRPTKHTPRSLQLWLTRFAIMSRIKMYDVMTKEAAAFGDFSKPDMYYQFYPEAYGARAGSLVPFSLRLLLAELPGCAGAPQQAIDRLYQILHVVRQMLTNLRAGKTEDGTGVITLEQDKSDSIRLWEGRETRVLHSIINCAIVMKDYKLALTQLQALTPAAPPAPPAAPTRRRAILSALCRLSLQAGHVRAAGQHQARAVEARQEICPLPDVRELVDQGLLEVAQGRYQEGYSQFARAADQEPTNLMVANNLAICLLYMGRLKDSIAVLQKALNSDPERGLNENLLINLCTLYELESSNPTEKKLNLLRMLCKYKSDKLPNVIECLKLNA